MPKIIDIIGARYSASVNDNNIIYPSLENAFQASRFSSLSMKLRFARMSPDEAAYHGTKFKTTVKDWDKNKTGIMRRLFAKKLDDKDFRAALMLAGPSDIAVMAKKAKPGTADEVFMPLVEDYIRNL